MKKLYVNSWLSVQDLGSAIYILRRKGILPKTLSGAINAVVKDYGLDDLLSEEEALAQVLEVCPSRLIQELKR